MAKTVTLTASVSTNPTFSERYFLDLRNTTGGKNTQMTTRHEDSNGVVDFLIKCKKSAAANNVTLTFIDETGELQDLL